MRLSAATVGMLLGLALLFSSCGEGGSTAADRSANGASAAASMTSERTPGPGVTATNGCRRQLGRFVAAMADLRDRLARGFSYEEYLRAIGTTRSTYARISAARVPVGCLVASGGPGERAFNLYIEAANAWGDCLATTACETRSIEAELQRRWELAADQLSLAQAGLRR